MKACDETMTIKVIWGHFGALWSRVSRCLQPEYEKLNLGKEMNSKTYLLKAFFNILIKNSAVLEFRAQKWQKIRYVKSKIKFILEQT